MKKTLSIIMAIVLCLTCLAGCAGGTKDDGTFTVGVCQLMKHDSLDQATQGFIDALTEAVEAQGKKVEIDTQVAGDANLCTTVVNTFVSKKVDLIMANATPALLAAANATTTIPVLGTSVTDYDNTFESGIPANVSGTSDAVAFEDQAQMMIDTLGLVKGDKVGVIYCSNESNSLVQYEAVKKLFDEKEIVCEAYTFSETTELQTVTAAAAADCKAIYVPSDNTVAASDTIVGSVCTQNKVPVFTSYGGAICYASLAIDYYRLGVLTGEMAADILLGNKEMADLEILTSEPTKVYNKDLCAQLGITVPEV